MQNILYEKSLEILLQSYEGVDCKRLEEKCKLVDNLFPYATQLDYKVSAVIALYAIGDNDVS